MANTERSACASHGFSGVPKIKAKGARTGPSNEMLAAPRKNAIQTLAGDPGRSPAAITSHKINSAGATAAAPMTLGRDERRFIEFVLRYFSAATSASGNSPPLAHSSQLNRGIQQDAASLPAAGMDRAKAWARQRHGRGGELDGSLPQEVALIVTQYPQPGPQEVTAKPS